MEYKVKFKPVLQSFFKQHKVEYFHQFENQYFFSCFLCGERAKVDFDNTLWQCMTCEIKGNLIDLIKLVKDEPAPNRVKIYNPARERKRIKKKFGYLKTLEMDESIIKYVQKLEQEVNILLTYLIKEEKQNIADKRPEIF
ncbi:hypothetical protein [Peribacillus deserti]|uniref:Uncharacterized protein n=1 Tax=Peribacillus deserti TaxID=673318 RepID=A0A2N5M4G8_9BACI|nr:hypothetical protein [Peribacillus deserti]PLT29266.1 hypothetical protein CUU66_13935 [Peribacillus deserti]